MLLGKAGKEAQYSIISREALEAKQRAQSRVKAQMVAMSEAGNADDNQKQERCEIVSDRERVGEAWLKVKARAAWSRKPTGRKQAMKLASPANGLTALEVEIKSGWRPLARGAESMALFCAAGGAGGTNTHLTDSAAQNDTLQSRRSGL